MLDMNFGEDRSRMSERCATRNFAILCRIALNLLSAKALIEASLKGKRKVAA